MKKNLKNGDPKRKKIMKLHNWSWYKRADNSLGLGIVLVIPYLRYLLQLR